MKNCIKLINGDFRDNLDLFGDDSIVITDPPYNINYNYLEYKDNMNETEYSEMFGLLKNKRVITIHYPEDTIKYIIPQLGIPKQIVSWVYSSNIPRQHRMIAWFNCSPDFSKVKQPYKNLEDKRVQKLISNGSIGCDLYDWWNIDLVKNVSKEKTNYTNQIPEEVIHRIIKTTANENDIIIDPFMGSGTTCVVAEKLNQKYIGIDLSKAAYDITKNRLLNVSPLFNV